MIRKSRKNLLFTYKQKKKKKDKVISLSLEYDPRQCSPFSQQLE